MNPIRTLSDHGQPTFGSWFNVQCNLTAEKYGGLGFDWVILDMQHGSTMWSGVSPLMQALQLGGTHTLIRIHRHDPAEIGLALDLGAIGIIAPLVSTPEEARSIAAALQYPPRGNRSWGGSRTVLGADTLSHDPFCIVMVETVEGLKNIDEIAGTPGVDCVLLGAYDLALSMGIAKERINLNADLPEIDAALDEIVGACRRHRKVAGNIAFDRAGAEAQLARGVRFLAIGAATMYMMQTATERLSELEPLKAYYRIQDETADAD